LSKTQKNAILFDRVNNFTVNALTDRILSYPSHIIDEFILTSDADYLVKFIGEVRNSKKPLKSIKSKTDAFKVFIPKENNQNDLEERKGQNDMIQDIKYAVTNGKIIISEAPPGTGKSLAYLLPCIGEIKNGKRTVISTNTKNLQMQIFNNDAAIASDISNVSFSACVLKGIGNYLCLQKYYDNKNFIEPLMVLALEGFMLMYESGDLAEMKFFYKTDMKDITSDSEYCMDKDCPYSSKCFFLKLRNMAKTSEIIFTNHYLSLIDASMSNRFFGEYQITVFDEAHNLENVVTDLFAYEYNFKYVMRMLYYFQKRINRVIRNITMKKEDGELKDGFNKIILIINELINNNEILLFSIKDKITFESGRRKKYNTSLLS
ncbi:DEAD/DEAH box helicase, partial [candidate division WOR-3 bacterium]|nr:DEAD/DEAH box helicase [candidate division WOR-3 bacterium]